MAQNDVTGKPTVLVLGGVGFIGRHVVHYLVTNALAGKIRVADKVMPPMAWLSPAHKESFAQVEFKHANLINPKSCANAFQSPDGVPYDYVINCAAETKLGQTEAVYRDGVYKLSGNCAKEAAKLSVKRYVEVSTAQMAATDKTPFREDGACDPWTKVARQKLAVERELQDITGLNYVVLRPAIVYGPGDKAGLATKLVIGGIYKYLNEKLKHEEERTWRKDKEELLWTRDLKVNTVHVEDVAKALWHLCDHGNQGEVYHLVDRGDTTQGKIGDLVSEIFNINLDYLGSLVSNMAKLSMEDVVEDINDKHMLPWGELCQRNLIANTPLSPYLEQELLQCRAVYVDGRKLEDTGFRLNHPQLNRTLLQQVLDEYMSMGLFPKSLTS